MRENRQPLLSLILCAIIAAALAASFIGFSRGGGGHQAGDGGQKTLLASDDNDGHPIPLGPAGSAPSGGRDAGAPAKLLKGAASRAWDGAAKSTETLTPDGYRSDPSDKSDGVITGVVLDKAGKPAVGAFVTCVRCNVVIDYPQWSTDIVEYSKQLLTYYEQQRIQTRVVKSDAKGEFSLSGLDRKLAYRLGAAQNGATDAVENVAVGTRVMLFLPVMAQLRGKVIDENGKPVLSLTVYTRASDQDWSNPHPLNSKDGTFTVPVPPGHVSVWATSAGHGPSEKAEATVGAAGGDVTLVLRADVVLTGVVTDAQSHPLANATVMIASAESDAVTHFSDDTVEFTTFSDIPEEMLGSFVQTDSKGRYRASGLVAQKYSVTARFGDIVHEEKVSLNSGINWRDFTLENSARAAIRVTDEKDKPVDEFQVTFTKGNPGEDRGQMAGVALPWRERGLLEFDGLTPGPCTITITVAGYPSVRRGEVLKDGAVPDFAFRVAPGAYLFGKVATTVGVAPGLNIHVRLYRTDNPASPPVAVAMGTDGGYELGPVDCGEWTGQLTDSEGNSRPHQKITLAPGDNKLDMSLDSGGSLRVTFKEADGKPAIYSSLILTRKLADRNENLVATSDDHGVAIFAFLEPGPYQLRASSSQTSGSVSQTVIVQLGANDIVVQIPAANCLIISEVFDDSQAQKAGIQAGDVILEYNGEKIVTREDLLKQIDACRSRDAVSIQIDRDGTPMTFTIKGGAIGISVDAHTR